MRPGPFIAGIAVVIAAAVAVVALGRGDGDYVIRAHFAAVEGLKPDFDVRMHGARVGAVRSLRLMDDDSVIVTMAIERDAAPLGTEATAHIRNANLLGGKYVDVAPGDRVRPVASGALIPRSRTGAPVDLDEVLAVLDPPTRTRLAIVINSMGTAAGGRGVSFGRLLRELPSSLDRSSSLLAELSADNATLGRLVEESGELVAAIAPYRRHLGALVAEARGALSETARHDRELAATVEAAPATIEQLDSTLTRLDATAGPLAQAAGALRSSAGPLTAVLRELPRVRPSAVAALAQLRRAAPSLTDLGRRATPFVRRLRPASRSLGNFAAALVPVSATFDEGAVNVLRTLEGWARSIQVRDGAGHMFRNQLVFSPDLVSVLTRGYLAPPRRSSRGGRRSAQGVSPAANVAPAPAAPPARSKPRLPAVKLPLKSPLPNVKISPPPAARDLQAALEYLLDP